MNKRKLISIVVPVYNEEDNIPLFLNRTLNVFKSLSNYDYEIIFAMDPSTDKTENIIFNENKKNPNIKLIKFSRRFGQPMATLAGIHYCLGDACIIIDVDLQDPPELIKDMVEKWEDGFDVVYAQRKTRKGETLIKRFVSFIGYWAINRISNVNIPRNTGDFRLIDRCVINHLSQLKETHGFLRGLVALVGFKQTSVFYDRDSRFAGHGNYNRWLGSLTIGLNGIIGFSSYPLKLISIIGFTISFLSFLLASIYFTLKVLGYDIAWGNPTLVMLISFLAGVQLLSIGIMGEYVGRIYDEVKQRPLYIIEQLIGLEEKTEGSIK